MVKKSLIFGGISTASYGVFISGEGVYNAPERAVEMVTIPGRDGALAIDQGRFENVVVEYPAFVRARSQKEMRKKLAAFKNAILSQIGYQRIEDTYHPEEFRIGVYHSGLEVEPVLYGTAAKFTLAFNCKPQRFLKQGEEVVEPGQSIYSASGSKLHNPTAFRSQPLISVDGYGAIDIGGQGVVLNDVVIGDVAMEIQHRLNEGYAYASLNEFNEGDEITWSEAYAKVRVMPVGTAEPSSIEWTTTEGVNAEVKYVSGYYFIDFYCGHAEFEVGEEKTVQDEVDVVVTAGAGSITIHVQLRRQAYHDSNKLFMSYKWDISGTGRIRQTRYEAQSIGEISVYSTKPAVAGTAYIDCESGECYKIVNGEAVSVNRYIDVGADFPVLEPGENVIKAENTITSLGITPRWWEI